MKIKKSTIFMVLALLFWTPLFLLYSPVMRWDVFDFVANLPIGPILMAAYYSGSVFFSLAFWYWLKAKGLTFASSSVRTFIVLITMIVIWLAPAVTQPPAPNGVMVRKPLQEYPGVGLVVAMPPGAKLNCSSDCQIEVCVDWKPIQCGSNPWDIGCCMRWETVCDSNCEEPEPGDDPPSITGNVSCTQTGSNGWCIGNAMLNLTASDPQGYTLTISGNIGGTPFTCAVGNTCSQTLPNGNGAIIYSVTASQSGLSANGSTAWKRDSVPPNVTQNIPSATGSNGWFKTLPVAISASGSDAHSGLAATQVSVDGGGWSNNVLMNTDGSYTILFRATDNAGNTSTTTQTVNVDTAPPSFTTSTSGTSGNAGWYVSDAVTTIFASDALSGVDHVEHNQNSTAWQTGPSTTSNDGDNSIDVRVYDVAGNIASTSLTVKVDTVPPVITPSMSGTSGSNGWLISPSSVSATAEDATSGMKEEVQASIGGGAWQSLPVTLNDGVYSISFRTYDLAGNEGTTSLEASIDTTPPTVDLVFNGTQGLNGWYISDVDVIASATDALSGLDTYDVRSNGGIWSQLITLSEGIHNVDARAMDNAGNISSTSDALHIDTSSPFSIYTSHAFDDVVSKTVMLEGESSDAISGLQSAEISTDGGSSWTSTILSDGLWSYTWNTSSLLNGTYTVLMRGIDVAGNVEEPISLTLIVANHPPKVKITDSWWIWESGEYKISTNTFQISEIKVIISDPKSRWSPVKLTYSPNLASSGVTWDRRFGEVIAPSGNYPAVVTACDIYGNCASDKGLIKIPIIAPVPPTTTPTVVPTIVPTETVVKVTSSPQPKPTQSIPPVVVNEPPSEAPQQQMHNHDVSWVVLMLALLILLFGTTALLDPRPNALRSLARTINQFNEE